jgi:hypothetical protein
MPEAPRPKPPGSEPPGKPGTSLAKMKEIAGAEGERMQESDEALVEERTKDQNRKCLPTSGGDLL